MDHLERFLAACRNMVPDRPPVWILRQAGRYLPEYRRMRKKHSFKEILSSPELSAAVALQPVRRFGLDASILFSDILVVPKALGVRVNFSERGVLLDPVICSARDLKKLDWSGGGRDFGIQARAIRNIRSEVGERFPIIGFAGAPFTLACYMISGGGSDSNFMRTRVLASSNPALLADLMERLSDGVARSLAAQVEASADAFILFDSLADILSPGDYERIALPSLQRVLDALRDRKVPAIYYLRGVRPPVGKIASAGVEVFAADWRVSLGEVKREAGGRIALQGNMDPALLFAGEERIRAEVRRIVGETGGEGHIFNLGAGIFPDSPVAGVKAMVEEVKGRC